VLRVVVVQTADITAYVRELETLKALYKKKATLAESNQSELGAGGWIRRRPPSLQRYGAGPPASVISPLLCVAASSSTVMSPLL
jgi:hypothetical protein